MAKKKTKEKIKNSEAEPVLKDNTRKKQNKQVMISVILMIAVIVIIVAIPIVYKTFFNKFTYTNLEFEKTKLGQLNFYSTKIPIVEKAPPEGHLITPKEVSSYYSINFRNDPRKLEYIPVNITLKNSTQMDFIKVNTAYISLDPNMKRCDDNSVALVNFAGFLRDIVGLKLRSAVSDENASRELQITYITCEKNPLNTVINLRSGNETKIEKTGKNCYVLTFKDCEVTQVTEKFDLAVLEGYMKYFE
ncbi:Uncharacterised protein [uncultured archaeon]|nr:Uncharacterised protein [uncultured archaeon]